MLVRRPCLFCLNEGMLYKFDKNGRPYASCMLCGARCFFHTREALTGPSAFSELCAKVGLDKVREFARGLGANPLDLMPVAPAPTVRSDGSSTSIILSSSQKKRKGYT